MKEESIKENLIQFGYAKFKKQGSIRNHFLWRKVNLIDKIPSQVKFITSIPYRCQSQIHASGRD